MKALLLKSLSGVLAGYWWLIERNGILQRLTQ